MSSEDFQPFWTFSRVVEEEGTIPVVIQIWDADDIENNDDIIDLNPQDNAQELVLTLDLATCTWAGDAGNNGTFSVGDGDHEHFGALEGGERGRILFDVACSQTGDIDKDGIPDGVERFGVFDSNGIKVSNLSDGVNQVDPCRPNIVVEIDFMGGAADGHSHRPSSTALTEVRTAFDNAGLLVPTLSPSECPYAGFPTQTGGGIGMILIVDDQVPEQPSIQMPNLAGIRNANFVPELKSYVHYSLWGHNLGSGSTSGQCCDGVSGKDFLVTLGSWPGQTGRPRQQSGTFMHELGHSLGFHHWGGDRIDLDQNGKAIADGRNCKPNYLSVMNYWFQVTGIFDNNTGTQAIDYSRSVLATLNEASLSEAAGISNGTLVTAWCDPTRTQRGGPGNVWLDWNWNQTASPDPGSISVDIAAETADRGNCCSNASGTMASAGETLRGFDDWSNLQFRAAMAPGAGAESKVFEENLTPDDAEDIEKFWEGQLRCSPPKSGGWVIGRNCTIWRDVTAPGDLVVEGDTVLKIGPNVTLDIDFALHALRVAPNARVEVQAGGQIK